MKFPFSKLRVSRTFSLDIVKARGIENLRGFCDSLGCGMNIQRSQETGAHFCSTINPAGPYNTKNKHTNSNKNKITLDRAPDWLGPGSSSQSNCRIGWAPACRVDVLRLEISSLLFQKQDVQTTLGLLLKQIILQAQISLTPDCVSSALGSTSGNFIISQQRRHPPPTFHSAFGAYSTSLK